VTGFASRYTPEPTYDVPPVLASPVAYQREPSPASWRSPPLSDGSESLSGVQLPPPVVDRQTPPLAPAAYTWSAVSAARPVIRPVTWPAPPLELEYQSRYRGSSAS
jgi:hypothetical protein